MAEKTYPMTLQKRKGGTKLEELKLVRRPEGGWNGLRSLVHMVASQKTLRYEAAKDEQAFVEGQISGLETKIRYAKSSIVTLLR